MNDSLLANLKFNKKVLLTGAGFTKDFGGCLANEMWSFIFNSRSLDDFAKIKEILRSDFSYESVYYEIIEGVEYQEEEKTAIKEAVQTAYEQLDENIKGYWEKQSSKVSKANATSLTTFISNFMGRSNETGFFFTLNQDIFVERYCHLSSISTPGCSSQANIRDNIDITDQHKVQLPADVGSVNLKASKFNYVKLHGSYHWRDSVGNTYMVIGNKKTEQIHREPLLKYYFDMFKEVLSSGDVELFVIGYGFADEHINEVILDSIVGHGLKLFIMNPDDPETFKNGLTNKPYCNKLWDNICGYYPYKISTVFPPDNAATCTSIECKQIMKDYFGL